MDTNRIVILLPFNWKSSPYFTYQQVCEPVKNPVQHISEVGQKRTSTDFEKCYSSPKRFLEKFDSTEYKLEQNMKSKQGGNSNNASLAYGSSKRSLGSR
ncbi:unnamed protein product [Trichobilharzia regenti]|nr:unnamed protein product [Trichobilharzia regenti]